jgi:secreted trypsin-like serine protease
MLPIRVAHLDVGGVRQCSGVLIAQGWVATASTCFPESNASGPPARQTTVTIGRADLTAASGGSVRTVTNLVRHPDRNLVLARLHAPVAGITPIRLATTAPVVGEVLRVAGYGRTAAEWLPQRLSTAEFAVQTVADGTVGILGTGEQPASTCRGDAGGPAFRDGAGGPELVGVNAGSWQGGCLGETETRRDASESRLDDITDWITANTPRLSPANVAVPGGGFESGLTGWSQWGTGGNTASKDRAYEGTTAAKVTDTSATAATGLESTKVSAVAGVGYTAYAMVYVETGVPSLYLRFYDSAGALVGNNAVGYTGAAGRWQPLTLTATAPDGAVRMTALVYSSSTNTGTAYFDQVGLRQASDLPVLNPGFENGLTNWSQYGLGGNTASRDHPYAGTSDAKIVDSSATGSTGLASAMVPATAGLGYTVSARVYVETGVPSLYLRFYDDADTLVGNFAVGFVGAAQQWLPLELSAIAPHGATRVATLLYSSSTNTGTAYFDQVTIH